MDRRRINMLKKQNKELRSTYMTENRFRWKIRMNENEKGGFAND